jgi:protein-disulfide isomerase
MSRRPIFARVSARELLRMAAALLLTFVGAATTATAQASAQPAKGTTDSVTRQLFLARTKGSATAPMTVYEMSDFQCPFCRNFALNTFPALEEKYVKTGKIRWVFVNLPLTSLHKNAVAAAEFAMCAAQQKKFWPAHDILYRTQDAWAPLKEPGAFLLTLADSVKLEKAPLLTCLKSEVMQAEVQADAQGANRAGATSTPSFYIEGGILPGAQPLELFTQIFDSIYTAKTGRK